MSWGSNRRQMGSGMQAKRRPSGANSPTAICKRWWQERPVAANWYGRYSVTKEEEEEQEDDAVG